MSNFTSSKAIGFVAAIVLAIFAVALIRHHQMVNGGFAMLMVTAIEVFALLTAFAKQLSPSVKCVIAFSVIMCVKALITILQF